MAKIPQPTEPDHPRGDQVILQIVGERIGSDEGEIDLVDLWHILWAGKWWVVLTTSIMVALGIAYALTAQEWFRAETVLVPADRDTVQSLPGQLGGLARLAGIGQGSRNDVEALAVLTSRDFTAEFIETQGLMPTLYADQWDAEAGKWLTNDPDELPDIREAVRLFEKSVRKVEEEPATGLVKMTIEWKDPEVAAEWANALVYSLNQRMRKQAIERAEQHLKYLDAAAQDTNVVSLQQAIARLVETELQNLMLAQGSEEFSFRVIDRARPPKYRSKPNRTLIAILSFLLGGAIGVFGVFLRHFVVQSSAAKR